jgi:hypothetical protein
MQFFQVIAVLSGFALTWGVPANAEDFVGPVQYDANTGEPVITGLSY